MNGKDDGDWGTLGKCKFTTTRNEEENFRVTSRTITNISTVWRYRWENFTIFPFSHTLYISNSFALLWIVLVSSDYAIFGSLEFLYNPFRFCDLFSLRTLSSLNRNVVENIMTVARCSIERELSLAQHWMTIRKSHLRLFRFRKSATQRFHHFSFP